MRLALFIALTIALGGCKSTSQSQTDATVRDDGLDRDRMGQIEEHAQRSGIQVHWVNPPRKPSQ